MITRRWLHWLAGMIIVGVAAACSAGSPEPTSNEQAAPPLLPTQLTLTPIQDVTLETPTPFPTITPLPTPELEPTTPLLDNAAQFQVVYVAPDDVLHVRSGPGVGNDIIGELPPDATGITITGDGQMVEGSLWVPITANGTSGWVNTVYLTEIITTTDFCQDAAANTLITDLQKALHDRNGAVLAGLVHPTRGLTIHWHWGNPAVNIPPETITDVFSDSASYYWGIEDGSGLDINGSFAEVALPLLDNDLVLGTEIACNQILAGNTTGMVRLPDGYDQINHYSVYRPATDIGFDWGSWVVGIEKIEGRYIVTYLVHFAWEI